RSSSGHLCRRGPNGTASAVQGDAAMRRNTACCGLSAVRSTRVTTTAKERPDWNVRSDDFR
ncbi:hypothetical protein, partial [Paenibacillus ginsengihumi]|uniref:hypothetical protein n=1 Tax=Paenibacillus ginsengihumi TaxID=431596 RepID=UPI001B7FA619